MCRTCSIMGAHCAYATCAARKPKMVARAWRQNKTCDSLGRRVSRIYRPTSGRADYRIIINWNVTSVGLKFLFIYSAIIGLRLHLIFAQLLPLSLLPPRTLVHCQTLIDRQMAVSFDWKNSEKFAQFLANRDQSSDISSYRKFYNSYAN